MTTSAPPVGFRHEALLYSSGTEFVTATTSFLRAGVAADDAMMVAVDLSKIDALRDVLGGEAESICFVDMADIGRNPATIIPAWQDFVDAHAEEARALRGIGEPVWPARTADELSECHQHEALLNLAFDADVPFHVLCTYDTSALGPSALETARRTHPQIATASGSEASEHFDGSDLVSSLLGSPLPSPPADAAMLLFERAGLRECRDFVARHAAAAPVDRSADLAVAVSEITTNSVLYGGGEGVLRLWHDNGAVVCEVADHGRITDPLIGRRRPDGSHPGGRGLWLANRLCDLVQVRSGEHGTVVRLHLTLG
jgi:anti-sigma regulatory factor (Ser/Thr protein kinase)